MVVALHLLYIQTSMKVTGRTKLKKSGALSVPCTLKISALSEWNIEPPD